MQHNHFQHPSIEEQFKYHPPKTESRILNHTQNSDASLCYAKAWLKAIAELRQAELEYKQTISGCVSSPIYQNKIEAVLHSVKQQAFCLLDKQQPVKTGDYQELINEVQIVRTLVNQQITFEELSQEEVES